MEGAAAAAEQPKPGVIKSAGKPVAMNFNQQTGADNTDTPPPDAGANNANNNGDGNNAGAGANNDQPDERFKDFSDDDLKKVLAQRKIIPEGVVNLKDINEDQLKALLTEKGIPFTGNLEELKKKVEYTPPPADPTPEEKIKLEEAFNKRMLDFYLANGGKVDDFVALSKIASSDNLKDYSIAEIKKEMKDNGFDDKEIDLVLKERYFQMNPDELVIAQDETQEDFEARKKLAKKKNEFGTKKLESRGKFMKDRATSVIDGIKKAIQQEDLLSKKESEFSSKVDEMIKNFPRKSQLQLGQADGKDLAPIEDFETKEEVLNEIATILKDPKKRNEFFFNPDNTLNLSNIIDLFISKKNFQSAVKTALLTGGDRQVAEFEKIFPGKSWKDVGLGGGNSGGDKKPQKGKIVSAGKPERVVVQQN